MDLVKAMELAAKGMKAQGVRMRVISENMANAETTPTSPEQDPYRRQVVTFKNELNRSDNLRYVEIDKVAADQAQLGLPAAEEAMRTSSTRGSRSSRSRPARRTRPSSSCPAARRRSPPSR